MNTTSLIGAESIIKPLVPRADSGWREIPCDPRVSMGYPSRAFIHDRARIFVISAVEVAKDADNIDRGPEYHISVSRFGTVPGDVQRVSTLEAKHVLAQFGLEGAEEDNHVPHGKVRNFWRTVAEPMVGLECACKADEPAIREDRGDFIWRP